nr:unnamed protein product [Digitaria exilis]
MKLLGFLSNGKVDNGDIDNARKEFTHFIMKTVDIKNYPAARELTNEELLMAVRQATVMVRRWCASRSCWVGASSRARRAEGSGHVVEVSLAVKDADSMAVSGEGTLRLFAVAMEGAGGDQEAGALEEVVGMVWRMWPDAMEAWPRVDLEEGAPWLYIGERELDGEID